MSEPSAISAPDAGPGDSSLTSNEKTSGSIQHRHEEIVKASIEIDNDNTSFRRLDNNKSPSELSESNTGGPVSYLPPPPKYDPSGFYTHAYRQKFGVNELPSAERVISHPPKSFLSATKTGTGKMNIEEAKEATGKDTSAFISKRRNRSFSSDGISIHRPSSPLAIPSRDRQRSESLFVDESPAHPTKQSISSALEVDPVEVPTSSGAVLPPQSWSEIPPLPRAPAHPISTPGQELFAVDDIQQKPQQFRTLTSSPSGYEKPLSEYRRRQNQAAMRKSHIIDNGSPEGRRQQLVPTGPQSTREMLVEERPKKVPSTRKTPKKGVMSVGISGREQDFEVQDSPVTPGQHQQRSNTHTPTPTGFASPAGPYNEHTAGPSTSISRRRARSPSPAFSDFSQPGYSPVRYPEYTARGRSAQQASKYGDSPLNQAKASRLAADAEYGYYDQDSNWIATPRFNGPQRKMREDSGGIVFQDEEDEDDDFPVPQRRGSAPSAKKPRLGERSQHSSPISNPFSIPAGDRRPSRYSGEENIWSVNQDPVMVSQDKISDAALKKRNLSRTDSEKQCPRGYGANDPENIRIVNMKETQGLSFAKIAEALNETRIQEGRKPSMTACGVTSRYNRTAPLLFASQGKTFVPLSKRKGKVDAHGTRTGQPAWTPDLDLLLVEKFKEFEQSRWSTIAQMMEDATGLPFNAQSVARRHTML